MGGLTNTVLLPKYVVTSATEPTNPFEGQLWFDTTVNETKVYDGSNFVTVSEDLDEYDIRDAQIILEILRLSAEGTLTAPDYDNMFVDYFSDADGQDDTIDTGNTTSIFRDSAYTTLTDGTTEAIATPSGTNSQTVKCGVQIQLETTAPLSVVSKGATCTATKAYIYNEDGTSQIASASFVGDDATFIPSVELTALTKYRIAVDNNGSSYNNPATTGTVPYDSGNVNWLGRFINITASINTSERGRSVESLTFAGENVSNLVQTNAQALQEEPTYILVHSKDKTIEGTSSITYDVSFDGGSTYDSTDNVLDDKVTITDGSSKNMVLKLNLNSGASDEQVIIKDYEVILWNS